MTSPDIDQPARVLSVGRQMPDRGEPVVPATPYPPALTEGESSVSEQNLTRL